MTRLLFVCLGNICRSPAAKGVMRGLTAGRGQSLTLDSAGTSGWHVGDPPYAPMIRAATRRGHDLTQLRAHAFTRLRAFRSIALSRQQGETLYHTRDLDGVLALIEQGLASLLDQLATEQ